MRYLFLAFLIVIAVVLVAFALVNRDTAEVNVPFAEVNFSGPLFLILLASYGFGMLSGWTVLGFLRTTIRRASEHSHHSNETA